MTRSDFADALPSWSEGATKTSIYDFVQRVTDPFSGGYVQPEERVAVFDNDGTLWCEKPMPVQADFLLRRVGEMAEQDPSLKSRQPFKAVAEHDYTWLSRAITNHYRGDDDNLKEMLAGLLMAYQGSSVEEFEVKATEFLQSARHPAWDRPYTHCVYQPMLELLGYLGENGFISYIASGGGRDFMRVITEQAYGIPPERVIGSSVSLGYDSERHAIIHGPEPELFDDGPEKVVRIWSRIGRKPILACGNSNGDIEMLDFASRSKPALDLLILHDDAMHEYSYVTGAEKAVDQATRQGWTIVSMKNDWQQVFPEATTATTEAPPTGS